MFINDILFVVVSRWTYADPSWARIAALVPVVVSCAEAGDEVANKVLFDSVEELALSVKAVIQRLGLSGEGGHTYGTFFLYSASIETIVMILLMYIYFHPQFDAVLFGPLGL